MKKLILFLSVITILYSCQKDDTSILNENIEIKEFVPTSNNNANYLVQTFLKNVPNSSLSVKNKSLTINPKEPNESVWIIEGASNFERMTKTFIKSDTVEKFDITINNFTDSDGEIKIDPAELINKYNLIANTINNKETELNKTSKIINIDIVSIDNSTTEISISAIYGNGENYITSWPTSTEFIYEASEILTDSINNYLAINVINPSTAPIPPAGTDWLDGDYVWYSGVVAYNDNNYPSSLDKWAVEFFCNSCLYGQSGDMPLYQYDQYFNTIQQAAQIYADDNITVSRPLISLLVKGDMSVCVGCPNPQFQWFNNITTANVYYWIPDPSPVN